jgi:acyl-CoA reductase-like NAD-dependent aldehyde dehydrogenase
MHGTISENQTKSIDPATGQVIDSTPIHSIEQFNKIYESARESQPAWAAISVSERSKRILKIRDYMMSHLDDIAMAISKDNGKTCMDAMATEVLPSTMAISYYCKNAGKFLKDRSIKPGNIMLMNKRSKMVQVPFGVVGIISPWNYPFAIPFSEIIMALLAGNTVIVKVAAETQHVAKTLERVISSAKLPKGVFSCINLPGKTAGDALLDSGVDKLFFTGSVGVGKYLMGQAAKTLTPVSLELGGNDAMLVCEDADYRMAAAGAIWGGFQNCGQTCGGVERVYVHEKIYDQFMSELKSGTEALRQAQGSSESVDLGVMTTERQVKLVDEHLKDALDKGAKIFAESKTADKNSGSQFVPARVLIDCDHSMLVMKDETFGPILAVMKVKNMDEAVDLANDSDLGLTASVWSSNHSNAESLGRRIMAGAITINDHVMSHGLAETPWGGFKSSGIGRTHGAEGFAEMTEPQVIVQDILPLRRRNMWWFPFDQTSYLGIRGVIESLYAPSLSRRISGTIALLKLFPKSFTRG